MKPPPIALLCIMAGFAIGVAFMMLMDIVLR